MVGSDLLQVSKFYIGEEFSKFPTDIRKNLGQERCQNKEQKTEIEN